MDLFEAYQEIEKRLEKIDFPSLFAGFHPFPFALYNDTQACIGGQTVQKPAAFLANTAVMYDGAYTAIWQLSEETKDFDTLTSKIVHEMLHAFQNAAGESRWADEREALVKYRCDEISLTARLKEAACMQDCLSGNAPDAFPLLLSLRKARMERFPFAYDYEARIEQIEGTAHFVELAALEQLDAEKAKARWTRMLEDLMDPARYFPARAVTYLSGAAFIACLRKYASFDTDRFTDEPFAVAALEGVKPCTLPAADPQAAACLAAWRKGIKDTVDQALEKGDIVLEGPCRMIAWNVYDGTWDGKYAVLTHFLGYIEGDELPDTDEELFARMKTLNGDFVAEVDVQLRLFRVWRC